MFSLTQTATSYAARLVAALLGAALVCACAFAAPQIVQRRAIAVLASSAVGRTPAELEAAITARTGLKAQVGAPISDHIVTITVPCPVADSDCAAAFAALRASGLFDSVEWDQRRKREQ
jgi:hypothetical protein